MKKYSRVCHFYTLYPFILLSLSPHARTDERTDGSYEMWKKSKHDGEKRDELRAFKLEPSATRLGKNCHDPWPRLVPVHHHEHRDLYPGRDRCA